MGKSRFQSIAGLLVFGSFLFVILGFTGKPPLYYEYAGEWVLEGGSCVAVAPDGTVFVNGLSYSLLHRFTASGSYLGAWRVGGEDELFWPQDVAVTGDGTVYVAGRRRIKRFDAEGSLLGQFGVKGDPFYDFYSAHTLAVAPDGTVYVGETYRMDETNPMEDLTPPAFIVYFTNTGSFLGGWGDAEGREFDIPAGMCFAPDGTLYLADYLNHCIRHFEADGTYLGRIGKERTGREEGEFDLPGDVAVAPDGTVFILDSGNDRVQYFTASGSFLGAWGEEGSGPGQFRAREGIAVGPNGFVYVVDSVNNRVQYFRPVAADDK
ncbi:MAG: hypothetical protein V3T30_02880 [Thermodesulfobacteriota bacterium]